MFVGSSGSDVRSGLMGGDRSQPPSLLGAVNPVGPGIHGSSSSSGSSTTGNTVSLRQTRRWSKPTTSAYLIAIIFKSFVFKGIIKTASIYFFLFFFFLRFTPRKQRRGFSDSGELFTRRPCWWGATDRWARWKPTFESSPGWYVRIAAIVPNGYDKPLRVFCRCDVIWLRLSTC